MLLALTAEAHPEGDRIDLRWGPAPALAGEPTEPAPDAVRLVRRLSTHPTTPEPGSPAAGVVVVAAGAPAGEVADRGLRGDTVHYYALFPLRRGRDGSMAVAGPPVRGAALATARGGLADRMYELLPAIYQRFDTTRALRRLLDLPGGQLDQLFSATRSMLDLADVRRVDGRLLPLLAQWIDWRTDHSREIDQQRNEVRNAPALYRAVGLAPVLRATVQRVNGGESRIREFVQNVARTNRPPRLTIWQRSRTSAGWGPAELLVLDAAAAGGRVSTVPDRAGGAWLAYHSDVPAPEPPPHDVPGSTGPPPRPSSRLHLKHLGPTTTEGSTLAQRWEPGIVLAQSRLRYRDPTVAVHGDVLRVFWGAYDPARNHWALRVRTREDAVWSAVAEFVPPGADASAQRRDPVAALDANGGMWLFWQEHTGAGWRLRYNRHDGQRWQAARSPEVPGGDGSLLANLTVAVQPGLPAPRVWLSWAREVPVPPPPDAAPVPGPPPTRWRIFTRVKEGAALDAGWGEVAPMAPAADGEHDREPWIAVRSDGEVELFFSSQRGGSWAVWSSVRDQAAGTWRLARRAGDPPEPARSAPAQRAPALLDAPGAPNLLLFRSSAGLRHTSETYSGFTSVDTTNAGTTTLPTRNAGLRRARGTYDDAGTYVHDAGRAAGDLYSGETVGVFVRADTEDAEIARLEQVLREFLPATNRAVVLRER